METKNRSVVKLPPPAQDGQLALEATISRRRSIRTFSADSLSLSEVSQLLWAAQGITHPDGYRTVASAGALFPLEAYVLVGRVEGLCAGVFRYAPAEHHLTQFATGDRWGQLWSTVLANRQVKESAAVLVFTARYEPIVNKYGAGTERFVHMEVGHAVQNVYLQAVALGLATVVVGSFTAAEVSDIVGCPEPEVPMVMMPVGRAL
jgi:SagB-type dehydrogenase family enzyme